MSTPKFSRKILLIFDIDETLIQYIPKKFNDKILPKVKEFGFEYKEEKDIVIFRPHLKKLFNFLKKNKEHIRVALWTYSDQDYANGIADILTHHCKLDENFFLFKYSSDHIDEDIPKNLQQVWNKFEQFNKFNTFLVDDRPANLYHDTNIRNSIIIQPFIPFGPNKEREILSDEHIKEQSNDDQFDSLIKICATLIEDIEGCSDKDIECAFDKEHIFSDKRLERSGLVRHMKPYTKKGKPIVMMTMGSKPHEDNNFTRRGGKIRCGKIRRLHSERKTRRKRRTQNKRK